MQYQLLNQICSSLSVSNSTKLDLYQVQQKSNPLQLFAVFLATAWNFSTKFYTSM